MINAILFHYRKGQCTTDVKMYVNAKKRNNVKEWLIKNGRLTRFYTWLCPSPKTVMPLAQEWPMYQSLHLYKRKKIIVVFIPKGRWSGSYRGCRQSWLTNGALVYEPKCGGRGGAAGSHPISTAVRRSLNKLWRSYSISYGWNRNLRGLHTVFYNL